MIIFLSNKNPLLYHYKKINFVQTLQLKKKTEIKFKKYWKRILKMWKRNFFNDKILTTDVHLYIENCETSSWVMQSVRWLSKDWRRILFLCKKCRIVHHQKPSVAHIYIHTHIKTKIMYTRHLYIIVWLPVTTFLYKQIDSGYKQKKKKLLCI